MPRKTSKPDLDVSQLAASLVAAVTGTSYPKGSAYRTLIKNRMKKTLDAKKDPAAVALGRKGGLKGGKARARALTAQQRVDIAKKAIAARWAKHRTVKKMTPGQLNALRKAGSKARASKAAGASIPVLDHT